MIKDKKVEPQEKSSVRLTVTVDKESAATEYGTLVSDYARSVQMKGFRRGHVPVNVLERKFGDELKMEAAEKILEKSLKEVFDEIEQKPLPYSTPRMENELDLDFDKDFTYTVSYDVYPEIQLGPYRELEIEAPQVTIGAEDEERELSALQEQNSVVMDKEGGSAEKEDILTVNYVELDGEGNEVPDTARQDFVFTVGSGYNTYKFDDDVIGMKVGDEKVIEKDFADDYEIETLRGQHKRIRVTVTAIKQKQLPAIDDELAQDISEKYETLDDLKKDIRKRLEESAESRIRQMKADAIMDKISEKSHIDLPESMVNAELASSWRNFVSQLRAQEEQVVAMLEAQGKSQEELFNEWRPSAEKSLVSQLLIHKMIEEEKIEAADEDVDAEIRRQAESGSMSFEDLKDYYEKNGMLDMLRHDIQERKLFDLLFEVNTVKKGKKVKFIDLMQRNQ
ncbi:trigger factor [Salinispira pacifica]